jgi:hypothetical protein
MTLTLAGYVIGSLAAIIAQSARLRWAHRTINELHGTIKELETARYDRAEVIASWLGMVPIGELTEIPMDLPEGAEQRHRGYLNQAHRPERWPEK